MIKILLFIFALLFAFVLYTRKFVNPYKLIFIFGKKGAFKSTSMIREMKKHQKKGWTIYTDMKDCILPGVRIFDVKDLGKFIPPPRSCVFLDEVGITYDNRNWKNFPPEVRDYFKFQRKYKNKVYMNSQAFDIDPKLRALVDSMILQTSILDCISISRPIRRSICLTEPSAESESRIADRLSFSPLWDWKILYMPPYFKYFNSFDAPPRPFLNFTQIPAALREDRKTALSSLRSAAHSLNRKDDKE